MMGGFLLSNTYRGGLITIVNYIVVWWAEQVQLGICSVLECKLVRSENAHLVGIRSSQRAYVCPAYRQSVTGKVQGVQQAQTTSKPWHHEEEKQGKLTHAREKKQQQQMH